MRVKSLERFRNPTYNFNFCYFLLSNKDIIGKKYKFWRKILQIVYEKSEMRKEFFLHDKKRLILNISDFTYSILAASSWREESRTADQWEAIPESTWAVRSNAFARRWWSIGESLKGLLGPVVVLLGVFKIPSSYSSVYSVLEANLERGAKFWNV